MYVMPQGVIYSSHSAVETNLFDLEWGGGGGGQGGGQPHFGNE